MNFFVLRTHLVLCFCFLSLSVQAQESVQTLSHELQTLKSKIDQLTEDIARLKAAPQMQKIEFPPAANQDNTSAEAAEFDRIKAKAEALEDQFENQGLKGLKISGAVDPVFVVNRLQKNAGFSFLNGFSGSDSAGVYAYDNSFFGLGLLDFQKETRDSTKFRLTMAFGKSAGSLNNGNALLHEATASIPLSDLQTRLLVGQIPDFSGYEPFFSHMQPLISHNLLFDFAAPAFYTGAGIEILRDKWLTKAIVGNMNYARYKAGDSTPTVAVRVDYAKGEFKGFGFSAQNGRIGGSRFAMFEIDSYYIRGDVTLQSELATGRQDMAAYNGKTANWTGLSALLGYRFMPRYQLTIRGDAIKNSDNGGGILGSTGAACHSQDGAIVQARLDCRNGFGPGMVQTIAAGQWGVANPNQGVNRRALTVGLSYLLNPSVTLKTEYRLDSASAPAFIDLSNNSFKSNSHTFLTSVVATF
jgi:outer membrane murein-binding lipoprotein Lpp